MSISDKTAIVNEQGQILIPDVLREQQLNLAPGTRVVLWLEGSRLMLQEINEFVSSLPDTGSQCAGKRAKMAASAEMLAGSQYPFIHLIVQPCRKTRLQLCSQR
jgi:bifunctional DNA-binding transcriptional regulator/antitoxin component of YhaV-PrlF toxin-antitoxin module